MRKTRVLKRGSVYRARIESRQCPADLEQGARDFACLSGVGDDRDGSHLGPAPGMFFLNCRPQLTRLSEHMRFARPLREFRALAAGSGS
jgi:hypothetical protein